MPVYLAQAGDSGPVKIGFAENVAKRVASLQTGCPAPLRLLGIVDGSVNTERELHRRFAPKRIGGEWFDLNVADIAALSLTVVSIRRRQSRPASDLIDALGGTAKVAEIANVGMSAVSNWRKFGRLPPRLYLRIAAVAKERGVEVPEHLFEERTADPAPREAAA